MQKLTYINLRNERVTFAGAPYILSKLGGLGMPSVTVETLRGAYQQGDTSVSARREARHVTLTLHIAATSRAELYRLRSALLGVLSPERALDERGGRGLLVYENDFGRWQTPAIPDGGLDASNRIRDVQPNVKLTFRCESPYWYATAESEATFAATANTGFTLPFGFPIRFGRREYSQTVTNAGQIAAPVRVTIVGKGETPTLTNRATGRALKLTSPLPVGCTLCVNTDPAALSAVITDESGAETSAFGKLSIDTALQDFTLRPGANELVYSAGANGARTEIWVRWRAAFEGV